MRDFDVQTVELAAPFEVAFRYIADPRTLPEWTHAFRSVSNGRATMVTPGGSVEVGLRVESSRVAGTIDWIMTFPDGSVGRAFSRLIDRSNRALYSFVLMAPPVPLEQLEGALEEQARVLREELAALQRKLSCGLVSPERPCRCRRRLSEAVRLGRVTPGQLLFASDAEPATQFPKVLAEIRRLEDVRRVAALFRSHPDFTAPADLAARVRKLVEGGPPITEGRGSERSY